MKKVFIDGSAGTTGLRIYERLCGRKDIELITLSEEFRKDNNARKDAINSADIVFLCLPDAAAVEAVSFVENPNTCIIDTSTAHRTAEGWTYGFPEIGNRKEEIIKSKRIANPGCHASGFISLVAPLVECEILKKDVRLTCFSLTGYSGGGKKMIAQYQLVVAYALGTQQIGERQAIGRADGFGDKRAQHQYDAVSQQRFSRSFTHRSPAPAGNKPPLPRLARGCQPHRPSPTRWHRTDRRAPPRGIS